MAVEGKPAKLANSKQNAPVSTRTTRRKRQGGERRCEGPRELQIEGRNWITLNTPGMTLLETSVAYRCSLVYYY